ncbi:MAG TPA: glycoside hydrolase family 2 TIM barrel-domain containing protein, partial [Candidatus Paceibacterota bacterium]|nr:glycoside hydrolase family 2 TIM barrel-domain containing protein [Candidatus Paceibacterota bacterium]
QFHLGDVSGAQQPALDVSAWRRIDLPHDWSAEGEFSQTNASCTGFLPGGIGWYRKSFESDASWRGRKVFVAFDGVYRNSEVWINGHFLGQRAYGYSTFQFDLTPFLVTNAPNVLAVRVERENVADSRWYPGSGIYRHVWLTVAPQVHVPLWGNYITTPRANADAADVVVRTEVTNETAVAHSVRVAWQIEKPDGTLLPEQSQTHDLPANNGETFELWQKVSAPALWSLETPVLHTLVSRVFVDGELTDETRTPFGIRTFCFDANNGFSLNGKSIKLKGLCMHHDAGVVGAAVPDDMLARRLRLVKEIGGNAIRCSHNPMAPELYDLCDRLGLLVMDEAFDEWEIGKRKWVEGRNDGTAGRFGYSEDFRGWAERDAADMVRRDRNHPSIVMWSIGNEIDYPTDPYVLPETRTVEGFAQDSKLPQQTRLAAVAPKLIAAVKRQDPTRPVTMALANMVSSDATGLAQMLDVVGYNYQEQDYARDHQAFPTRIIYGSENGRGIEQWRAVTDNAYVGGQFLWVGFDFLGEADRWPNHGSQAGLFDTRGFKKSGALQRQAFWSDVPMISTFVALPGENGRRRGRFEPHWTWPQGTGRVRVVMFSNCDRAELRLNGKVIGSKTPGEDHSVSFETDYQPGELVSVGYCGDLAVATNSLVTAGEPSGVRFEMDRSDLPADGRSVAHVVVSVVD